ncbi:MAG: 4Fe-4S binding protein [Bacteroidales bacterium]|nr:4Fe-4S binding protein [Bacteroidales bacterium]
MAKNSTLKTNWPKYLLQWGVLIALGLFLSPLGAKLFPSAEAASPETYCPMGGLEAFATYLVRGSLPCSMTTVQIVMGLFLAAAVVLFSKLFCAFLCPVGSVEDLLIKLRKAIHLKSITVPEGSAADKVLRIFKYGLVFWIFYMTMNASELFCKNLDPYYAVATGFKGEITLWMSITTVTLVVLGGLLVNRFWCRYICPLGAISNSFKFWIWMVVLFGGYYVLTLAGVSIAWPWLLGAFCLLGYLLEIISGKPRLQALHVMKNESLCNKCGACELSCPYSIAISEYNGKVNSVDCTLCGECVATCRRDALYVGVTRRGRRRFFTKWIAPIIALGVLAAGYFIGKKFELPTINEKWGIEAYDADSNIVNLVDPASLVYFDMHDMKSVKCFGSSMAFKARLEKIAGTHGVKTYVGSHRVSILYDPAVVTEDEIKEKIFVPSHFRINSPDPKALPKLKVQTIRVEKMYDKLSLNYLGLQMRLTGKAVYGVESMYDCPVIVKVYMDPAETLDKDWYKEVVDKKTLDMPVHGGGVKQTPVDLEFVRVEPGESYIGISEYLHMMFDGFSAKFNGSYTAADGSSYVEKREAHYEGAAQYIYEVASQDYEKPIIKKALPYLSNWLSSAEGVISLELALNKELVPSIQVRYAAPMTAEKIWEMMTSPTWKITYKADDVREESARMSFPTPGIKYPYEK